MNLNEEVLRVRQHTRLNDVTLEHALLLKTNDELKQYAGSMVSKDSQIKQTKSC